MLAQMHFIVVSNDAALSVRKFLLQDEVLLNLYTLSDGGSLDLGTGCFLAVELSRVAHSPSRLPSASFPRDPRTGLTLLVLLFRCHGFLLAK